MTASDPARARSRPARDAWLQMYKRHFPEPTVDAEWQWMGRQLELPEERRQRAINSVWERTMAEKAGEHIAAGATGSMRRREG
jgi:hypothetical protein